MLLLLLGCSDTTISSTDEAPQVELLRPANGSVFDPVEVVELCAQVTDEGSLEALEFTLSSSVDGLLEIAPLDCAGGNVGASLSLSDATHVLTLSVTDPRGQAGIATATVEPSENSPPRCTLSRPSDDDAIELGQSFVIEGAVEDDESDAAALRVSLESDVEGTVWEDAPPSSGAIDLSWTPVEPGEHWLALRVEDPRGLAAECLATVYVDPCLDEDEDGWSTCEGDCDDLDPTSNPDGQEVPDGADNDCDDTVDEGTALGDDDGDGFTEVDGDCDDDDPAVHPDAAEIPYDGVDQDCDGGDAIDLDGDGYAGSGADCDDGDASVHPGATETWYDGVDQDCDGASDYDADGDGYDADAYAGTDCDDGDVTIHPGATEIWYDGTDQDCDGASDYDADGDGDDSEDYGGADCDDGDSTVHSAASETRDGLDNDCDASCDEGLLTQGDLIVSEIMKDPSAVGDDYGEWFEVYNTTSVDIGLCAAWLFEDADGESFALAGGTQVTVPAGGHAVLGRSANTSTNGGVTVDYAYATGFRLANGDDEIILVHDGTEIDRVEYKNGSGWPDPTGASLNLAPAKHDPVSNDSASSWCTGSTSYGLGDKGTPGSANDGC